MQLLAIDIGTGTQDILLFDTRHEPENALKMILPSPTQRVAEEIRQAMVRGEPVLLVGATMGGGPCAWAAGEYLRAGGVIYATPAAACTFNDDLAAVMEMGVRIVSEDEARELAGVRRIELRDVDWDALRQAFALFGVRLAPAAVGVAVFDHGAAPAGYSDRRFRFDQLAARLRDHPRLQALSYLAEELPAYLTRMKAVAGSFPLDCPLLFMDTPSAAVLGAREDPHVRAAEDCIAVNIGNQHTLAFRLHGEVVTGLFEHHTGKLTAGRLDELIGQLAAGDIDSEAVFQDHGHGALLLDTAPLERFLLSVTGPRRAVLRASRHRPYFAVPYGDMMVAGCWGLVRAMAGRLPALADEIEGALARGQ
jgi:uncharacterized protein (DUF1786 family)